MEPAPAQLLHHGPETGPTLVLAHGAGAPMDSDFMNDMADRLAARGLHVVRFEFAYMAARRTHGKRTPPARMPQLLQEYHAVLELIAAGPVFIGGKSMGGRAASMLAAQADAPAAIAGLVCLGYPFHPPGRPESLRTAHLANLRCPALIVQGERDPFGTAEEVPGLALPPSIAFHWCPAGNHDLVPPNRSGHSAQDNLAAAAKAIADFVWAKSRQDG